jgi:hypothetical protein
MSSIQAVLRNQYSSTTTFVLGLLLFFMPFVQLKCKPNKKDSEKPVVVWQNLPPVSMTGFEMMTGKVHTAKSPETSAMQKLYEVSIRSVPFVILAFLCGIIGFIFSLMDFGGRPITIVVTGTLSAIFLIVVRFTFIDNLNPGLHLEHANVKDVVEVNFTVWFYLSIISFMVTALLGYFQGLFALNNKHAVSDYELEL